MSDVDSNGVDWLDRFRAYSERFRQSSVAGEIYEDTIKHIEQLRKERDEARQMYCKLWELPWRTGGIKKAKELGWDCFKDGDIQRQKILDEITSAEKIKNDALDRLAKLDEELGLI